jgi:hypothetical protein
MKTLVFDIKKVKAGDRLIIACTSPRGGRTHVLRTIEEKDTPVSVAAALAEDVGKTWMQDCFQARSNDKAQLIINCSDQVSNLVFYWEVERSDKHPTGTDLTQTEF